MLLPALVSLLDCDVAVLYAVCGIRASSSRRRRSTSDHRNAERGESVREKQRSLMREQHYEHPAKQETDVLIVGVGPAGLTMACELRRRDISCHLIDKQAELPMTSRAKGLQAWTVEVFDYVGVIESSLHRVRPINTAGSYEEDAGAVTVRSPTSEKTGGVTRAQALYDDGMGGR